MKDGSMGDGNMGDSSAGVSVADSEFLGGRQWKQGREVGDRGKQEVLWLHCSRCERQDSIADVFSWIEVWGEM